MQSQHSTQNFAFGTAHGTMAGTQAGAKVAGMNTCIGNMKETDRRRKRQMAVTVGLIVMFLVGLLAGAAAREQAGFVRSAKHPRAAAAAQVAVQKHH